MDHDLVNDPPTADADDSLSVDLFADLTEDLRVTVANWRAEHGLLFSNEAAWDDLTEQLAAKVKDAFGV
ncbi:hypothetical protein ACIQOV_20350 [Kitasatospora sp. NPDC091257]|uniref:hypothetical protein n=1 Tax=Kitasatospora sp. NPDC091257 TaxID=3364084 RepID=UPI00380A2FFC